MEVLAKQSREKSAGTTPGSFMSLKEKEDEISELRNQILQMSKFVSQRDDLVKENERLRNERGQKQPQDKGQNALDQKVAWLYERTAFEKQLKDARAQIASLQKDKETRVSSKSVDETNQSTAQTSVPKPGPQSIVLKENISAQSTEMTAVGPMTYFERHKSQSQQATTGASQVRPTHVSPPQTTPLSLRPSLSSFVPPQASDNGQSVRILQATLAQKVQELDKEKKDRLEELATLRKELEIVTGQKNHNLPSLNRGLSGQNNGKLADLQRDLDKANKEKEFFKGQLNELRMGNTNNTVRGADANKGVRAAYNEALKCAGQECPACTSCYVPFNSQFRGAPEDPSAKYIALRCKKCNAENMRWDV